MTYTCQRDIDSPLFFFVFFFLRTRDIDWTVCIWKEENLEAVKCNIRATGGAERNQRKVFVRICFSLLSLSLSLSSDFFCASTKLPSSPRSRPPSVTRSADQGRLLASRLRLASLPSPNADATAYLTRRATRLRGAANRMAAPGLDEVMAFLTDHGFAGAASALRDDVLARAASAAGDAGSDSDAALDPQLPPLRLPASTSGGGGAPAAPPASPGSSSDSASSSAFVSMRSSPSGS